MSGDLVKIKPLEWRDAFGTQCAGSIFGFYAIRERGWEHVVHLRGEEISRHASPEKAMVGAQEHHDALVLGVLEPTQAAAEITRLRSENAELVAERDTLKKTVRSCQWYWPEGDTTEDNCASGPQEVVESLYGWSTPTGEVVAVARGGIVDITYCAALPPAEDADSDDEFWVEECTQEAAQEKIDAEIKRREALSRVSGGGNA